MANSLTGFTLEGDDERAYVASFPPFALGAWELTAEAALDTAVREAHDYIDQLAAVAREDWEYAHRQPPRDLQTWQDFACFFVAHRLRLIKDRFFDEWGGADFVGALLLARVLKPDERCDALDKEVWHDVCARALEELPNLPLDHNFFRMGLIDGNAGRAMWTFEFSSDEENADYRRGYGVAGFARMNILNTAMHRELDYDFYLRTMASDV